MLQKEKEWILPKELLDLHAGWEAFDGGCWEREEEAYTSLRRMRTAWSLFHILGVVSTYCPRCHVWALCRGTSKPKLMEPLPLGKALWDQGAQTWSIRADSRSRWQGTTLTIILVTEATLTVHTCAKHFTCISNNNSCIHWVLTTYQALV